MVDDLCIMRGMHTEQINHDPAINLSANWKSNPWRPSMGSWLSYGLGSMNDNLPSYIAMTPSWTGRKDAQALYQRLWGSGFLPSEYQGIGFRSQGDPVLYLSDPKGVNSSYKTSYARQSFCNEQKTF